MSSITCGNCSLTHTSVADVKACYTAGPKVRIPGLNVAVAIPNDRRWGTDDRELDSTQPDNRVADRRTYSTVSRGYTGRLWTAADSGIYVGDNTGDIYKVYKAMQHDGMLVKRLDPTANSWSYEGSARKVLGNLDNHHKITEAEAKQFGAIYGVCAICGRTLTDEGSIAAGIGPVCAGKQGW